MSNKDSTKGEKQGFHEEQEFHGQIEQGMQSFHKHQGLCGRIVQELCEQQGSQCKFSLIKEFLSSQDSVGSLIKDSIHSL